MHLTCFLQKLPSRYTHMKSNREVEPEEFVHDEFTKDKSVHKKIVRSGNKRGRWTNEGQARGTQGQGAGRGRRTVRKRRVGKRAVEDLLLGHTTASHWGCC